MELEIKNENGNLIIKVIGKLDTITATELENTILNNSAGISAIVFDLEKLDYISSSGLRVLLSTRKRMENMKILNPKEEVLNVLEMTGLAEIFNIENN